METPSVGILGFVMFYFISGILSYSANSRRMQKTKEVPNYWDVILVLIPYVNTCFLAALYCMEVERYLKKVGLNNLPKKFYRYYE